MDPSLRESLDRTLLLVRDDLVPEVSDAKLIEALTRTEVVLGADSRNLASHSAQCAFITAATLMARSGHQVYIAAPDVPLVGAQPPLRSRHLVTALMEIGSDLLPGVEFSVTLPKSVVDISVSFGDSAPGPAARRALSLNAGPWTARLGTSTPPARWFEDEWPFGGLAVGALASVEAFKAAIQSLRPFARDRGLFDALFAFTDHVALELAPSDAGRTSTLGRFDLVSGGAITSSSLFALARIQEVTGRVRVIEPDVGDLSNLNRYPLLRRSAVGLQKATILQSLELGQLALDAVHARYEPGRLADFSEFAPHVLVGVDDIPTRWSVQTQNPSWLGVGATTHWSGMASFHVAGSGCVRCLHPRDDTTAGRIPTVAFVSFFAGLMLACYFVRARAGERVSKLEQCTYMSPLRSERIWRTSVAVRQDCPARLAAS